MAFAIDLSPVRARPEFRAAHAVVTRLKSAGYATYLVGGFPRDLLLGIAGKDIDIATAATPEQVGAVLPEIRTIGASFGVALCVQDGFPFEVASFRTEGEYRDGRHPANLNYTTDPRLDAERRDFTVNALYLDPDTGEILDFFDGINDLRRAILRTVGAPERRFAEDYLRMLRAVRFAVKRRFTIADDIQTAIRALAPKAATLSVERIRSELDGMLLSGTPAEAIRLLNNLGLLEHVLPEVAALKGVEQHPLYHPEGDVFVHTLLALEKLSHPDRITVWSTLLHDIGKPRTLTYGDDGVPHFYNHEHVGALMAETLTERLKFDRKTAEAIVHTVATHMRFVHFAEMRGAKQRRLLGDPMLRYEMEILRADTLASHGLLNTWLMILDRLAEFDGEPVLPPPLLDGRDVLKMGVKPGPKVGKILTRIRDLQLEGKINTHEDALKIAAELLKKRQ